jgi:teichoic acid transport system permease protein
MPETAVAESGTETGTRLRALAARHGLTSAAARPRVHAYLRELWRYRHFIATYADARVSSSLSTTKLGRIWQVLTPLTNAAVYYVVFGIILRSGGGMDNFGSYLCIGVFVFGFTQGSVQTGVQAITSNLGLIRALQFPRACLPVAMTLVELQNMVVGMAVLSTIVLITGEPLTLQWLLVIPLMVLQTIFNGGLALFTARLGAQMIDLKQIMPFALRVWMYGSAVLYPVQFFEEHAPRWLTPILEANPAVIFIELIRHAMMEGVQPVGSIPLLWAAAAGWALLVGLGGFLYFWLGEKEYGRG